MSDAEDYLEEDDIDEAYFYVEESFQVVVRESGTYDATSSTY